MTPAPVAYLRRSFVDADSPGDISREAQRAAVRRLAAADGHNGNLEEYDDWGISADHAKAGQRTAYARLLADMEAGKVSACYAWDVDRLYRDPRDLIRLQDAAQAHRVRIVTTSGPLAIGDGDDPSAEAFAFIGSIFGRMELQKAKKRASAAREARIARGDRFGHPVYGFRHVKDASGRIVRELDPSQSMAPIIAAYREAGTVLGAVRLLNARAVPSAKGGRWYTSALTRVLEAHAPELLPRRGASGQRIRPRHPSILSQLVRCHCGATMTPNTHRRQIYCNRGPGQPDHGRYTVQEKDIMPWIRAEASRFAPPSDTVKIVEEQAERREALIAQREQLGWALVNGVIKDRDAVQRQQAAIDGELAQLESVESIESLPDLSADETWQAPPAELNAALRSIWAYIEVDATMRPVRAEWSVPEWRRE